LNNADFVYLMYLNALQRPPDQGGFAFWVGQLNNGATRGQVMLGFSASPEFKLKDANPLLVNALYIGLLQRDALHDPRLRLVAQSIGQ
jgi:Domain of unknown function (DUF4214)